MPHIQTIISLIYVILIQIALALTFSTTIQLYNTWASSAYHDHVGWRGRGGGG